MTVLPVNSISVMLRWVPGSMHLVKFLAWGRTFVVALANVKFLSPLAQSPLYLKGSVLVSVSDVTLSVAEQRVFDDLMHLSGRDDVRIELPRGDGLAFQS